jgi:hypothetical protein
VQTSVEMMNRFAKKLKLCAHAHGARLCVRSLSSSESYEIFTGSCCVYQHAVSHTILTPCDPLLYIVTSGGHLEITFLLNMHIVNLKMSGQVDTYIFQF